MRGRLSWYIFGYVGGHLVADGPFATENKAYEAATAINDWDSDDWKTRQYATRSLSEAKSAYRHEQSQETGQLAPMLKPIRSTTTGVKWKRNKNKSSQRLEEIKQERGIF